MDESQDSGESGNFLSPGVGQGLASPNRWAPPAASARASPGQRARYKGRPGRSAPARSGLDSGQGSPASGAARGGRPEQHVRSAPGREEGTGAARRGLPEGPAASGASGGPPATLEMNGAAPPLLRRRPYDSLAAPDENRCGRRRLRLLLGPPRGEPSPAFPFPPDPARRPPDRGRPRRPTAARSPQLLAVRPRNSPVVGL